MQLTDANDAFIPTKNDDVTSGPRLFLTSMEFTFQASSALNAYYNHVKLYQGVRFKFAHSNTFRK
jgi:hypothetical protein